MTVTVLFGEMPERYFILQALFRVVDRKFNYSDWKYLTHNLV
jgi:hypothetical protein